MRPKTKGLLSADTVAVAVAFDVALRIIHAALGWDVFLVLKARGSLLKAPGSRLQAQCQGQYIIKAQGEHRSSRQEQGRGRGQYLIKD